MHYPIITLCWIHLDEQFLLTNNVLTHQQERRIAQWAQLGKDSNLLQLQNKAVFFPLMTGGGGNHWRSPIQTWHIKEYPHHIQYQPTWLSIKIMAEKARMQQFSQHLQEARETGISISISPLMLEALTKQLAKAGCITFAIQVSEYLRPNQSRTQPVYFMSQRVPTSSQMQFFSSGPHDWQSMQGTWI